MTKSRTKGQRRAASKAQRQRAAMTRAADGRRIIAPAPEPAVIGPTPERLAKARGLAEASYNRSTRIRDGVLERMAAGGHLCASPAHTRVLIEVAAELRRRWRIAGLDASPKSVNLLATGGGGGDPAYQMPVTVDAAMQRVFLRRARESVAAAHWAPMIDVVVMDHDLVAAGAPMARGEKDPKGRRALARHAVRHGLVELGEHWRMIDLRRWSGAAEWLEWTEDRGPPESP